MALEIPYIPVDDLNYPIIDMGSLPSALGRRLVDHGQYLLRYRLPATSMAWNLGPTDETTLEPDFASPEDAVGYRGRVAGSITEDTETIGFQFSSRPGNPVAIPIPFQYTGMGNAIEVLLTLKADNFVGSVAHVAAGYQSKGFSGVVPRPQIDRNTYLGDGSYLDATDLGEMVAAVSPTATVGTDGVSYLKLTIPMSQSAPNGELGTYQKSITKSDAFSTDGFIVIQFNSVVSTVGDEAETINTVKDDGWLIQIQSPFSKYFNNLNPGKFHYVIKVSYRDGANTYHHVMQARPSDLDDPYNVATDTELLIFPPIVQSRLSASSVDVMGYLTACRIYPVTRFTLMGASVHEVTL